MIVNNAAMNIGVLRFFQISILGFFGFIPRSGITGSKGKSIFNFLRYPHATLSPCSGCTSLHFHQQLNTGILLIALNKSPARTLKVLTLCTGFLPLSKFGHYSDVDSELIRLVVM